MDSNEILNMMSELRYEPTRLQGYLIGLVEDAFDGNTLVTDPSLPFPFLLESAVIMTTGAIQRDEILSTRQYPNMAKTDADLYHHLSDVDYAHMFGTPGGAWFDIYLEVNEILAKAVQVGGTKTRKLSIPRHTSIKVNGLVYTMQYPINIIVKSHGGIDVVYDSSLPSPLQTLRGNKVDKKYIKLRQITDGQQPIEFLQMRVFLKQMQLTTYSASVTESTAFKKTYTITDNYYYTRGFYQRQDGGWEEMLTTHSQQTFDPLKPTLLLRVVDNQLTVELPFTYVINKMVTRNLRIDVYTTTGPINMALGSIAPNAFEATYLDLDNSDNGIYSSPLSVMSTVSIASTDTATGGSVAPTFAERRERMLNNAIGVPVIPISNAQMGTTLTDLGFQSIKVTDDITKRAYLATRAMPDHLSGQASTGIDTAVITMKSAINEIVGLETVIDNGDRFTVTPKTLYRNINGGLEIQTDEQRKEIDLMSGERLVNYIANKNYLFTPLHYVLDCTENRFKVRPYYLADPSFDVASYSASNDTLGLTITGSNTRSIVQKDDGYVIQVQTASNDVWKALKDDQCHVQLAFLPQFETSYAYIKGVQIGKTADGERIYEFKIGTRWDITSEHKLITRSFQMYDATPRNFQVDLNVELMMLWSVSDYTVLGAEDSAVDPYLGLFQLPTDVTGVYHENVSMRLGDELSGLWAESRAMVGDRKVLTHRVDVPKLYETTEYELDPLTKQPKVGVIDGVKQLAILHRRGDLEKDDKGNQVIKFFKGEAVLDEYGNVIYESERNIIRWWDICLFDAVYRYSTDIQDVKYLRSVPNVLVDWINDTLGEVRKMGLDRTDLFFQPLNSLKHIEVLAEDGEDVTIYAAQSLRIDYYVSKQVYEDGALRVSLTESAIATAVKTLNASVVSRNGMETAIKVNAGTDVISVRVSYLGGLENDFNVITLKDESTRMSVAKVLSIRPDNTISVVDSIKVNFLRHTEG